MGTCKHKFASMGNLKAHERRHTGEENIGCPECEKSFSSVGNLKAHLKTHYGQEKPFECNTCEQKFVSKGNMKAHIRRHTDEKNIGCPECEKSFFSVGNLKAHLRTHNGQKPFKIIQAIQDQMKIYACFACGKTFNLPKYLNNHMNKIHVNLVKCDL